MYFQTFYTNLKINLKEPFLLMNILHKIVFSGILYHNNYYVIDKRQLSK